MVILLDDVGAEWFSEYQAVFGGSGPPPGYPSTPNITSILNKGVLFKHAWATPWCSSTRAALQTGMFPCRTGIGQRIVNTTSGDPTTVRPPTTLAELLKPRGYQQCGLFGKVHFAGGVPDNTSTGPICNLVKLQGGWYSYAFDCFAGHYAVQSNGIPPGTPLPANNAFCNWPGLDKWLASPSTVSPFCAVPAPPTANTIGYVHCNVSDLMTYWISTVPATTPLFCWYAPQLPFDDFHNPPSSQCTNGCCNNACGALHSYNPSGTGTTKHGQKAAPNTDEAYCFKAAIETADTLIGKLLTALSNRSGANWWTDTTIILMADNGTPDRSNATLPSANVNHYWEPSRVKGTVYEGGVRVPLIIAGKAVTRSLPYAFTQPVMAADIYATLADISGTVPAGLDGVSLYDILQGTSSSLSRSAIYTEEFAPNFPAGGSNPRNGTRWHQAATDGMYKVMRTWSWDNDPPGYQDSYAVYLGVYGGKQVVEVGTSRETAPTEFGVLESYLTSVCP